MKTTVYFILVLGMALATYIPRWFPLAFLSQRQLPEWFSDWLDFVPAAILSALIAPMLFINDASGTLDFLRPEFLVAIPTALFAFRTRSLGGTVMVGMLLFWLVGKL